MQRSETAKRTLDVAVLVVAVAFLMVVVTFSSLSNFEQGGPVSTEQIVALLVFGASCVVGLIGSAPFYEDLRRLDLPAGERRLWVLGWLILPPVAIAAYWYRYVRAG